MSFDSVDFTPSADGTLDNMKYGGINVSEIAQELKDNCDDAGAKNISIYMLAKDSKELSNLNEFIILDDGRGMDQENLWNSMRLAHRHEHGSEDIGKFGVGLKNATIGLGDEIIIITRTESSKTLGVFLNINDMRRQNTFKPTQFVEDGSLLKGWFPSSIWDKFDTQEGGTMILVKSIHNHHVHDVVELATNVHRSLNFNYSASTNASKASNASNTKVYYSLEDHLDVKHVDAFYRNDPSACAFVYEAELRVYKNGREDTVYEVVTSNRLRGRKLLRATLAKPLFYKFSALKKGTQADKDGAHAEVPILPSTAYPYKKMTVRFIEVSEDAYNKEGKTGDWDGFDTRRRGFFFRRGTRMVGSCMALEEKMDDWSNRFRMEVTFGPDLDLEMGVRTQKQMSKSVHAACISDSLRILWRQLVGPRIRERKAEKVVSDSDSEEKDVKKGTLNSFINISKKSPTPADETPVPAPRPVTPVTHDLPQSDDELSITDGAYVERTESSDELADKLADKLADEPADELADKLADELADELADKPADKLADELADKPADELADKLADKPADKLADELADKLADKLADESTGPEPPYDIDISNDSVQLKQGGKLISTIPGFSSASDLRDWIFRSADPVALVNHIAKFFIDQKN